MWARGPPCRRAPAPAPCRPAPEQGRRAPQPSRPAGSLPRERPCGHRTPRHRRRSVVSGAMAKTIAVLSQKGGTGKTTTVRTLTDVLRRTGLRTLAIDLDPQGNLSDYFDLTTNAEPTIPYILSVRSAHTAP